MTETFYQPSNNRDYTYGHGIICKNCMVRKVLEPESSVQYVRIGTFVQVHSIREDDVFFYVVRNDMQVETDQLMCSRSDVVYVPENLWGSLFPVEQSARLALVKDQKVAELMGNISVGHKVQVLGFHDKVVCIGIVTFKNSILRLGAGVYFGLKIEAPKDNFQAIIQNVSLLEPGTKGFPRGCDIVVAVNKIRPKSLSNNNDIVFNHDKEFQKNLISEEVDGTCLKSMISETLKDKNSKPFKKNNVINHQLQPESILNYSSINENLDCSNPLLVGDKVIYLNGNILETGVVKWIGNIKNLPKIGVEFDNPIGSGTGTVDGIELFQTKPLHALIVPPMALIKFSDYMMNNTNNNFQNKNNLNNNNNTSKKDFCDNLQLTNGKTKVVKSNSHQCLKHLDKTFYTSQTNKELMYGKHTCLTLEAKFDNSCDLHLNHNSRSFDFIESNKDRLNNQRQCDCFDSEFDEAEYSQLPVNFNTINNNAHQKTSNNEIFNLMESNWTNGKRFHNYIFEEKQNRNFNSILSPNKIKTTLDKKEVPNIHSEIDVWNSPDSEHSSSSESISNFCDFQKPMTSFDPEDFGQGSVVELVYKGKPHYGVIRWIGTIADDKNKESASSSKFRLMAGIEMEEEKNGLTDGTHNGKRYFQCNPKKALFVPLSKCRKDSRFVEESQKQNSLSRINYGQIDCPIVEGTIPPINPKSDLHFICGKNKGIQGHHNSCYLDATLFSMFAFTCVFDSLLYRPPTKQDIPQYTEVQRVLREEIVNPLRKNLYVRADRVMKLRTLLDKLSSVSGLTSEEKDPEEFLNSLLAQILKAEPFLKLSSGQEAFHYQLFVEKDERLTFPTVQQLFEQSFVASDIKLKQVPPCLIIQMPRFGKSFKMYSKILPPQLLDVTDIIENSPRQCTVCGKSAEFECKDCFGQTGITNGLESISFCRTCLETAHNHHSRTRHNYKVLTVPVEFSELQEHCIIPRLYMELFAVVCIETSHYVAFVKCGSGSDAPWCFFDSMADRKGEQNGYNIPEMVPCPDLPYWLSEDGAKTLIEMKDERYLPEHVKRLFSDAYMCMYQSPDMMMYR